MSSSPDEDAGRPSAGEPPPWRTPALRVHLQGTFLLIVVLLVFWAMLNWAGPVISGALGGPDGAIVATPLIEPEDSGADDSLLTDLDEPLEGDEIATLQSALTRFAYDPGPVDGIMGDLTRAATDAAKADLGLSSASDRRLLDTLAAAVGAPESASSDPDS